MSWFTNLPTRTKLTLGFGLLLFILLLIVATAFYAIRAVHEAERSVGETMELRAGLNGQRASLLAAILLPAGSEREERMQEVKQNSARNDQLLRGLAAKYRADAVLGRHVQQIASIRDEFVRTRDGEVIPLIAAGKEQAARDLMLGLQQERFEKIRLDAVAFTGLLSRSAEARRTGANWIFAILSVLAALLGVAMILGLTRSISRPLEQITAIADQIARGDLNVDFSITSRADEVGLLAQTFQNMTRALKGVAERARQIAAGDLTAQIKPVSEQDVLGTAFSTMTKNLRGIIQELVEAVNLLALTASQISASTAQLASSASETAAAVSETTTTVEEVKQTSQVSSQKAKYVSERAQSAADVSQAGKRSVDESIEGMHLIRQQMESVAESILSLSAQGQAIGEIIATVDDLAAQSKLLAVNASIQAAKAGDEGKGFAVVAQEVKTLAEQSRQATTQVRGILSEIQKATSRAVLATEQGSKAVDAGVIRSTAAGDSITELNESIAGAAQAATQIAATSQQQFVGMDQVALAMESIRTASTQTVASTRQTESAAQQMNELGQKLKRIAERFKV